MLDLRRPKLDAIWLEFLPSKMMRQPITNFWRHLPAHRRDGKRFVVRADEKLTAIIQGR
jgi:hypothetical protein